MVLFFTLPVSKVGAISPANTSASVVIGQPDMISNTANNGGVGSNTLNFPDSVYTDGTRLYVADFSNHRVLIYNTIPTTNNAAADVVVGQPDMVSNIQNNGGVGANTLRYPTAVFSDGTRLYIADYGNNRVLIYNTIPTTNNASANVVIGQPDMVSNTANNGGIGANALNGPFMAAAHGNKLFITDYLNHRVLIYNTIPTSNNASANVVIGQPDMVSNTANNGGIGANTLCQPATVDLNGTQLFIADIFNNRILIFNSIPTSNNASADVVIGQPDMVSSAPNNGGIGANTLYIPYSVITDSQHLFITDYYNHRILIFNSIPTANNASADVVIGQPDMISRVVNNGGLGGNTLYGAGAASISSTHLYVVDRINNRVLIYPLGPQNTSLSVPSTTTSRSATLTLSADDAKEMMISESSTFSGATWIPFSTNRQFTLSSGDGVKTVYVKMRDYANYEKILIAKVTLDTIAIDPVIKQIGSITNIPNKASLFYYFTSQSARIKGTSEPKSTVTFLYDKHKYATTASDKGLFDITIPNLPRERIDFEYYAKDLMDRVSHTKYLSLMIGEENFPQQPLTSETTPSVTPSVSVSPTPPSGLPSETPQPNVFEVTDQKGNLLISTTVYINSQRYVTDKNGKIVVQKQPIANMTVEVELNGKRVKGNVMGEKIVVEVPQAQSVKKSTWYWWILLLMIIVGIWFFVVKRNKRSK